MLRSWHGALRAAARAAAAPRHQHSALRVIPARHALPAVPARPLSVQTHTQPPAPEATAPSATPPPQHTPRKCKSHEKSSAPSVTKSKRVLMAPESTYAEARRAFEYLRAHRPQLRERHFLALLEKASAARDFDAVRAHFAQFCQALARGGVRQFAPPRATWTCYQSQRLQLHRHVLWAALQGGAPATRFRAMQHHFRKYELATTSNRLALYEGDPLNFLLRMECTLKFVPTAAATATTTTDVGSTQWLTRVRTILDEMRAQRFRTNYSSVHALFHFLMHRPDVALDTSNGEDADADSGRQKEDDADADKPAEAVAEDRAILRLLNRLFDEYPRELERDPRRVSLAVSTAASAGRVGLALALLRDADARGVAVDAASFAHVVTMAKDEPTRLAVADLYLRAKDLGRIYERDDNQSMKTYVLLYAIRDGNFTQITELLHEMEYNQIAATPQTVAMLFASVATYRATLRHRHRDAPPHELAAALQTCPTVLQLLTNFPTVLERNTHACSHAILQALRAGDVDVALAVLRSVVQASTSAATRPRQIPLRAEVFSQVLYAVLARDASSKRDVLAAREVERLFDAQHTGRRDHLTAQLLNLCESNRDLETMIAVLDDEHARAAPRPLSKRSLDRVFNAISLHLKAIRKQDDATRTENGAEDGEDGGDDDHEVTSSSARYKLGALELSFRGVLEKYPMLVPLNAATLERALMRSVTAQLVDDVATLVRVAHARALPLDMAVYKVALDVLHEAAHAPPASVSARDAVRDTLRAMQANGVWPRFQEQYPDVAAKLSHA